jgi:hypothetical protein
VDGYRDWKEEIWREFDGIYGGGTKEVMKFNEKERYGQIVGRAGSLCRGGAKPRFWLNDGNIMLIQIKRRKICH